MNCLTIAYYCEGRTDQRFLAPIITKTFEELVQKAEGSTAIDVVAPFYKGKSTLPHVRETLDDIGGYRVAVVHVDADGFSAKAHLDKIVEPILKALQEVEEAPIGVPLIPVQETEAWMLADVDLLMEILGTNKNRQTLGLSQQPEAITDPKEAINNAIKKVRQEMPPKWRKRLSIGPLYEDIGTRLSIEKLQALPSYRAFYKAAEQSLRDINFIP